MEDLPCKDLVERVTDYLDLALSPAELQRTEAHLSVCEGCVEHVAQIRRTVTLLGRLPDDDERLPADVRSRLLGTFRSWQRGRPGPLRTHRSGDT